MVTLSDQQAWELSHYINGIQRLLGGSVNTGITGRGGARGVVGAQARGLANDTASGMSNTPRNVRRRQRRRTTQQTNNTP